MTKLREALETIDRKAEAGLCYFTLESARCFHKEIRAFAQEVLSTSITTEALDSYVAQQVKEALIDHISLANFLRFDDSTQDYSIDAAIDASPPLPAQPTEQPK